VVGTTNRDEVNIANGLRLRDEAKEIRDDLLMVTNDIGRVAEFVDVHWVMQRPVPVVTPEVRELRHDLIIVGLGAPRDVHARNTSCAPSNARLQLLPEAVANRRLEAVSCKPLFGRAPFGFGLLANMTRNTYR
jgi:hypothetical protein